MLRAPALAVDAAASVSRPTGGAGVRALVVDACGLRGALVGVRGLGRAGWTVGVATACPPGLAGASRWCQRVHAIPRAAEDPRGFVDAVADVAEGYDVVFPAGDAELMGLSRDRQRLGTRLPYPPHAVLEASLDKQVLAERAAVAGLASPRAHDVTAVRDGTAPLPLVAKQRWAGGAANARWETLRIDTAAQMAAHLRDLARDGPPPLYQEVVEGDLLALSVLLDRHGAVVAAVQSVGDPRTWPPGLGMRVHSRTVPVDADLLERVRRLLADHGWWGLADVDFLAPADGPPRLIDCNGRFYASMAIALAAGINFPDLWGRLALGLPVPSGLLGQPGVRYHWLEGDLRRAVAMGSAPRDVLRTLRLAVGATHTTASRLDPAPMAHRIRELGARTWRRVSDRGG